MTSVSLGAGEQPAHSFARRAAQLTLLAVVLAGAVTTALTNSSTVGMASIALAVLVIAPYFLRTWRSALVLLLLVILFIPIKRYSLPVNLPLDIEPYRLVVAGLMLVWIGALLVDRRFGLPRTGIGLPMSVWFLVILVSICVNFLYIDNDNLTSQVIKTLSFQLSFLLVFFLLCSVLRNRGDIELVLRVLVGGAAIVGFTAVIEYNTGYNVFNHLSSFFPILHFEGIPPSLADLTRDSRLRVYASSQHPIALAAALVMLMPLGVYLGMSSKQARWWLATFLIGIGSITSLSRTGITMTIGAGIVLAWMRPVETRRLLPLLVPATIAVFLALPHALGTLESVFFPKGGIIADQSTVGSAGGGYKDGRLATLGPGLSKWLKHPIAGRGFGTSVVDSNNPDLDNTNILDDQWLDSLIETGSVGVGVMIWLFIRTTRRLRRIAKQAGPRDGLLAGVLAASLLSFAVGMFTFDAFSFIQVTFIFFFELAIAAALLGQMREIQAPTTNAGLRHALALD